ncbi:MAG: hypothetical protein JJE17_07805 [Peptostreptococcaceae bacterium]|nr:hypothetical protein [Peptostreptococcaceae bacterium]
MDNKINNGNNKENNEKIYTTKPDPHPEHGNDNNGNGHQNPPKHEFHQGNNHSVGL